MFGAATCRTIAAGLNGDVPAPPSTMVLAPTTWERLCTTARGSGRDLAVVLTAAAALTVSRWTAGPCVVTGTLGDDPARTVGAGPDLSTWKGFAAYCEELVAGSVDAGRRPDVHQRVVADDAVRIEWRIADPDLTEVAGSMMAAFERLLDRLGEPHTWTDRSLGYDPTMQSVLPAADSPYGDAGPLLQDPARRQARLSPTLPAVITARATTSHHQLFSTAEHNAAVLSGAGIGPGDLVAVSLPKGPAQIAAVLAVAATGAGFVPISPTWPAARVAAIAATAGLRHAVIDAGIADHWPADVRLHLVGRDGRLSGKPGTTLGTAGPGDLAYVIFTSGSTGIPKGVAIEHRAARTTIDDITDRFAIHAADRILGLSALSFDLSIYDIFGVLGAGGAVVLPDPDCRHDPQHWLDLMAQHRVTVWNTAPALLEMLVEEAESRPADAATALGSLRLVLLSGDWIPVTLPDRIRALAPSAQIISLGGATEGSIWSISHPITTVEPGCTSIPYGRALRGQSFHVLDGDGGPCPVGQVGELYIGGAGLARGYLGDDEQTRDRFAVHDVLGERLYRTGDVGRWRPDGDIEFLGRTDRQVKVQGYRIELGELESVANRMPTVRQCVAATVDGPDGLRRLVAYVTMRDGTAAPTEADLRAEFRRHLPDYMVPAWVVLLTAIPVTANGKIDHAALPDPRR